MPPLGTLWPLLLLALATAAAAKPPQRIVTLSPHATELVIAAGGRERLVAAAAADEPLPDGVVVLQTFGGLDRERLLALRPDLVVAWTSGTRPADLAWLRKTGATLYLSEPADLAGIAADIRALGRLLGTEDMADAAADRFLTAVRTPCLALPKQAVYVEIWPHPPLSLGGRHWLNDVLRRLGLRNTFAAVPRAVFSVDPESLASREALPHLVLREPAGPDELGSSLLARPGPALARALPTLCQQRLNRK
ncbi:MAG: hypothetical protein D6720_04530 [Gammaproteobacteria bacterium]|nr:MAG: hypothetical protein D6720_04530 [Gammaproteobacteria bacterium]